jgi:transposase-like protein
MSRGIKITEATKEEKTRDAQSKLVEHILSQGSAEEIFGKEGLFASLKKQIVEKVLESELEHELGYSRHSKELKTKTNRRNGGYEKTIIDEDGHQLKIEVPRDREGEYEPILIPKGVRRFKGFDEKVISLYAMSMSTKKGLVICVKKGPLGS